MSIITPDVIKQCRILVVDDNSSNITLFERMLKQNSYQNVVTTTDPTKVMPLLESQAFDLLILDINMPVMDGFDVMRAIRERDFDFWLPIIVVTAQSDNGAKFRAMALGAKDFIVKPYEMQETLNRIRNTLESKIMHNRLEAQNQLLDAKVLERTRELELRSKELEEANIEILRALGRAAECKDNETGNHTIRMAKYAQLIALEAGYNHLDAQDLFYASPMHDVGKIGIPDNILLKPGKLTAEEYDTMKQHTTIGYNILRGGSKSKLVQLAQEIAVAHHEKWDGSGYPRGLKGADIPLNARVVAIADVFDALTATRPYKMPWSNEDAIEYIKGQSGAHFDPDLVAAFERAFPEIYKVQQQYKELTTLTAVCTTLPAREG